MTEVYIAAFDPGSKNFAFCVEKFYAEEIEEFSGIEPSYEDDGTPTKEFGKVLDTICSRGEIVLHDNIDISDGRKGKDLIQQTFINMTNALDEHADVWESCSHFLIETQMSFGRKLNLPAVKLAQHIYSYFSIKYPDKTIIDFPAYNKTQILGAPKVAKKGKKGIKYKAMEKPARKKWAVSKAKEILEERDDTETLKVITGRKKADDLADTFLMTQAAKFLLFCKS